MILIWIIILPSILTALGNYFGHSSFVLCPGWALSMLCAFKEPHRTILWLEKQIYYTLSSSVKWWEEAYIKFINTHKVFSASYWFSLESIHAVHYMGGYNLLCIFLESNTAGIPKKPLTWAKYNYILCIPRIKEKECFCKYVIALVHA